MIINLSKVLLICLACSFALSTYASDKHVKQIHKEKRGFFDQSNQYKGFYWFEQKKVESKKSEKVKYQIPTPDEALLIITQRKKKLDDARNQMIAVGLDINAPMKEIRASIIAYKKLEMNMWNGAVNMVAASDMANFVNPALSDNLEQPINVFGVRIKRDLEAEEQHRIILEFAQDFDFLLFTESHCKYSKSFTPVVKEFATKYNFNLDIASLDSDAGRIASKLGVKVVPTLIVVKKDNSQMFELVRGMASMSHLENSILLATKYSQELKKK